MVRSSLLISSVFVEAKVSGNRVHWILNRIIDIEDVDYCAWAVGNQTSLGLCTM